jgi:hypothetical protein
MKTNACHDQKDIYFFDIPYDNKLEGTNKKNNN